MKKNGFTFIELLVTATIISILAAIGVVSYGRTNINSRDAKRKSDLEQIRAALETYKADNGFYPATASPNYTSVASLTMLETGGYIPKLPADPVVGQIYSYNPEAPAAGPAPYYGYCLSAKLEGSNPTGDPCTEDTANSHNYAVKNP